MVAESLREEKSSEFNSRRKFLRFSIVSAILAAFSPFADGLSKVAGLKTVEKPAKISQNLTTEAVDSDKIRPDCCVPIACPSGVCYNGTYPYTGCTYGGGYSSGGGYSGGGCYSGGTSSPKQRADWKRSWSDDGRPQ